MSASLFYYYQVTDSVNLAYRGAIHIRMVIRTQIAITTKFQNIRILTISLQQHHTKMTLSSPSTLTPTPLPLRTPIHIPQYSRTLTLILPPHPRQSMLRCLSPTVILTPHVKMTIHTLLYLPIRRSIPIPMLTPTLILTLTLTPLRTTMIHI